MDFTSLGVDAGVIVAIGATAEAIKAADPSGKYKRFYLLIPVVLSVICAISMALITSEWTAVLMNVIKYFGISSFGYAFIKKTILKK